MQTTQRQHAAGVTERMQDEPWRYAFVQLLTMLLRRLRSEGVPYDHAFRDVLRFKNSLSLSFPASEVRALDITLHPDIAHIQRIEITPSFIGLLGVSGTLPLHDTERIAMRYAVDRDPGERALIDVFSNRVIGLFFEAWSKYRVEHSIHARGQDRLLPLLTALAGARPRSADDGIPDATRAYYAALLRTRPVSAGTIGRILSAQFGVPIVLEELAGAWDTIPENRRSTLGSAMPVLGHGAVLGTRVWRHDLRARLRIGPLDESQLAAFLPDGHALAALAAMMRQFAVPMVRYEVVRLLKPACVQPLRLTNGPQARQLGWTTFIAGPRATDPCKTIGTLLEPGSKC